VDFRKRLEDRVLACYRTELKRCPIGQPVKATLPEDP